MREILFKAKRLDNGEWVDGLLWKKKYYGTKVCISCFPDKDDDEKCFVVDPETVCQYTGRTNDNGVKIFEGDIVKDEIIFGDVVWDDPYIGFVINDIHDGHQEYSSWWNGLEVIGNIFDNPELLKGSAE